MAYLPDVVDASSRYRVGRVRDLRSDLARAAALAAVYSWGFIRLGTDSVFLALGTLLPWRAIETLVRPLSYIEALCLPGGRAICREYEATMRVRSRGKSLARTAAWYRHKQMDVLHMRRMGSSRFRGRYRVSHEGNQEAIDRLESGQPFVLVFGHFSATAIAGFLLADYPGRALVIRAAVERERLPWPHRRRWQLMSQQLEGVAARSRTELRVVVASSMSGWRAVVRALRDKHTVALVAGDAWSWDGMGTSRPLAGYREVRLPDGAARLARLAGVPAYVCTPVIESGGTVTFHWGASIPGTHSASEDAEAMDVLIDDLERHIGRFRDRYTLWVGPHRHWHDDEQRWCDSSCP